MGWWDPDQVTEGLGHCRGRVWFIVERWLPASVCRCDIRYESSERQGEDRKLEAVMEMEHI